MTPIPKTAPITFKTVKTLGLALPGVELGTTFGHPALKANGRLLAVIATNKSAESHSLCVSLSIATRDELVEADPSVYYLTPHYTPWPCVVVRLSRISKGALRDLLAMSRQYCLSHASTTPRKRKTRSPATRR